MCDGMQRSVRAYGSSDSWAGSRCDVGVHRWCLHGRSEPLRWRSVSQLRLRRSMLLCFLLVFGLLAYSGSAALASTTYELRGEWSYAVTCSCTFEPTSLHELTGTMLISSMDLTSGEYSGSGLLLELAPFTISGTVTGSELSLVLTAKHEATTTAFTMENGSVEDEGNRLSGSGVWTDGPDTPDPPPTGTFTATKIRSYEAIEKAEKEAREKAEREEAERKLAREKEQQEKAKHEAEAAKEKEQLEKEKAKQEAEAAIVREQQEKAERESREAKEKEAKSSSVSGSGGSTPQNPPSPSAMPAALLTRTCTVSGSGLVQLKLSNVNGYSISGEVTLSAAGAAATGSVAGGKGAAFGDGLFTIAPHGTKVVKVELSKSARASLKRSKSVRVAVKVTTSAGGQPAVVKTYDVTLKALVRRR